MQKTPDLRWPREFEARAERSHINQTGHLRPFVIRAIAASNSDRNYELQPPPDAARFFIRIHALLPAGDVGGQLRSETLRLDSSINRNRLILQVFIGNASLAKTGLFRLKYASNLTA